MVAKNQLSADKNILMAFLTLEQAVRALIWQINQQQSNVSYLVVLSMVLNKDCWISYDGS